MASTVSAQLSQKIAGKYTGDLFISLGEEVSDDSEPMPNQTVDITTAANTEKGGVDFAIHNFSFGDIPLGDILLPSISVSEDAAKRVVFGKNDAVELSFLDGAIMATASLDETKSYVSGDSLVAFINVMWTNNDPQIPIYVVFKGLTQKDSTATDTPEVNTPEQIKATTGNFTGDLFISLGEEVSDDSEPMPNQTVDITAAANTEKGGVDFAIHNFSFGDIPLGDILLPSISVTNDSLKRIVFGKNDAVELSFLDGAIMATASLDETKSYVSGDSLVAFINVMWTNNDPQIPIYVVFKGKKGSTTPDTPKVNTPEQIEATTGNFTGDLFISLGEEVSDDSEPMPNQTVDITAAANTEKGGVDFAIHNFSFGDIPLGDILLPSISVTTDSQNRIVFGKNDAVELSFLDGAIMATAALDETKSYVSGDSLVAFINVMWTNNDPQVPIYVVFKGKKGGTIDAITLPTNNAKKEDAIFDLLTGRRIQAADMHRHGIYLVNGKKVLK